MRIRISLLAAALIALEAFAQPKGPPSLPPQAAEKAQAIVPGKTAPMVTLTAPAAGALYAAPAAVMLEATATASSGRSIARVEFYAGTVMIGSASTAPYAFNWSSVEAGSYSLTARATDSLGVTASSAPVAIIVNAPPSVNLVSPASDATFKAPAEITLTADAADTDGTIAQVEFFNGGTLIGSRTGPPYSIVWSAVPQGSYSLSARVTDNHGAVTTSAAVGITVNQALAQIYFVHTDHLNTPRLITDDVGQVVWSWANDDPFGANVPNENPSGLGTFTCNLRLPGQYFDRETNLHYNYFRDYAPTLGRYIQSDPVGLAGGINTYLYVGSNPILWTDPSGLAAYQCRKPLDALGGTGLRSGPDIWGNPAYHQYSCVIDENGQITCGGQDRVGAGLSIPGTRWKGSEGKPSDDKYDSTRCKLTYDDKCFDNCLKEEWKKPRPKYGIPWGIDCQDYDDDVNSSCRKICGLK